MGYGQRNSRYGTDSGDAPEFVIPPPSTQRVPLVSPQQGIFKPRILPLIPLSILTTPAALTDLSRRTLKIVDTARLVLAQRRR